MKTSTVIALAVLGIAGVFAYKMYLKNQSQTNTTGFNIGGLSGTIPTTLLAGGVASLIGDIGGLFTGGGSNTSGGGGTYSTPDYSQWNAAYADPNAPTY
jgi:hypothetical protein